MEEKVFLGHGILGWDRSERITDRYGTVQLTKLANEREDEDVQFAVKELLGVYGKLCAVVRESRKSSHIGDMFRGIFPPETPTAIDTELILGNGHLFLEGFCSIGLYPAEKRETDWLDPHVLYCLHDQTVDLYFTKEEQHGL